MNNLSTLQLREYDSLGGLYSAMPKTIGSSVFSHGQEFLWTCVDVCEKYIAVGTSVGQLFLYDRSKAVICHQLSSQVFARYLLTFLPLYHFLLLLFFGRPMLVEGLIFSFIELAFLCRATLV